MRIPVLAGCAVVFVGISLTAFHWWFLDSRPFEADVLESVLEGAGVLGKPEYAPPGIQFPQVDRIVANACLLDGSARSGRGSDVGR